MHAERKDTSEQAKLWINSSQKGEPMRKIQGKNLQEKEALIKNQ